MAAQILPILCCLLVLIQTAAGSLVLDIHPTEIYPDLTQSLALNCTFSFDGVSDIVGIISLIISKENQQEQFDDLLSLNIFAPDDIKVADELNATNSVTGHISGDGQSFLAIQWSMPTSSEAGRYLCLVNGVNDDGHPTEKSQAMMVTSKKPDLDQLTNKVSNLQHQLDLQATINLNQSQTIDTLLSVTQTQSNMITTLLNTTANLKEKLELQGFFLPFYLSSKHRGHFYLLSKGEFYADSKEAEETCKNYGGYLAEINDSDEQEFVEGFLESQDNIVYIVLISGTDEGHPGNWTYAYSGGQLNYTNWAQGEPFDWAPNYDCIRIARNNSWQWISHLCRHQWHSERFLCEVDH